MKLPTRSVIGYFAILTFALPEALAGFISIANMGWIIVFFLLASGIPLSSAALCGLIQRQRVRDLPLWAKLLLIIGGVAQVVFIVLAIWVFIALNNFS